MNKPVIMTSSMERGLEFALEHNTDGCNFCIKKALAWGGISSPQEREETLRKIAEDWEDSEAKEILINAINEATK